MPKLYSKKLNRLKEILAIPTYFHAEHQLLKYIIDYLRTTPYTFDIDTFGNLYITKGQAEIYPLVCAHTDTVHHISTCTIEEITYHDKKKLIGRNHNGNQCGIGADDKAGVFVCLELLESTPAIKVALFAGEEYGCIGSQNSDPAFFENVGYALEFDCPGNSDITFYCNGIKLFEENGEFFTKVRPILIENMPSKLAMHSHPYTDVWPLKRRFSFSCINIATGYYHYHSDSEYVIVDDVMNAVTMGTKILEELGPVKYEFLSQINEVNTYEETMRQMKMRYPNIFTTENTYLQLLNETIEITQ